MKKPYDYKETVSTYKCIDCKQPLKANLLARKPEAVRCYTCYSLKSNNQNINRVMLKRKQAQRTIH